MTFVKGSSGNPAGRPKNGVSIRSCLRASMSYLTEETDAKGETRILSRGELLSERLFEAARKGDLVAIKLCLDNVDGPPVQQIDHSGSGLSIRIGGIQDPPQEIGVE